MIQKTGKLSLIKEQEVLKFEIENINGREHNRICCE